MTQVPPPAATDAATDMALAQRVHHPPAFVLHPDAAQHSARLLALMQPPHGTTVLDTGCGLGAVAQQMRAQRPDLRLMSLNHPEAQPDEAQPDGPHSTQQHRCTCQPLPLADHSVDVVLYNHAACPCRDGGTMLHEARRVLRSHGILFMHDTVRTPACNTQAGERMGTHLRTAGEVVQSVEDTGFVLEAGHFLTPAADPLCTQAHGDATQAAPAQGVEPAVWRFICCEPDTVAMHTEAIAAFERHQRIAFQFSGGRDSTAALYLLRPYWHRMQIYHIDTGDQFPETQDIVRRVEADLGQPLVRIPGHVHRVRDTHGLPSDLVPVDNTALGRTVSGQGPLLQSRYDCCYRALMQPLQARMQHDGITLLVRGQRDDEYVTPPLRSGDTQDGFEVLYPIQHWNGQQVSHYLRTQQLPLAPFYERGMRRAPECMGCTAWWDEGRAAYLQNYHPQAHTIYLKNMTVVRTAINQQASMLAHELEN